MKKSLDAFAKKIVKDSNLKKETFFACIQGETERYIQKKFAFYLNDTLRTKSQSQIIALESFHKTDMVIKEGVKLNFVEWKGLTLSIPSENENKFKEKICDNFRQLVICRAFLLKDHSKVKLSDVKFWSAFLLIQFNNKVINKHSVDPKEFDSHGIFQKKSYNNFISTEDLINRNLFSISKVSLSSQNIWKTLSVNNSPNSRQNILMALSIVDFSHVLNNFFLSNSISIAGNKVEITPWGSVDKISASNKEEWNKNFKDDIWKQVEKLVIPSHTSPETSPSNNSTPRTNKQESRR
jgi:hypothetical protein